MPKGLPSLGPPVPGAPAMEMSKNMKAMLQPTDLSKLPIAAPKPAMMKVTTKMPTKKEMKKQEE